MKKLILTGIVLLVVAAMAQNAAAATVNAQVAVSASIAAGKCNAGNTNGVLNFGAIDPSAVAAPVTPASVTAIDFKCTNGLPYNVAVGAAGSMSDGLGHTLPYTLTAPVTAGGNGGGFSATKTISLTPSGSIALIDAQDAYNADNANPLAYTQTVTVTITY